MKITYAILLTFIFSAAAVGQTRTLGGTVSDPNGNIIQGANVTVRRGAAVFTTTTDREGRFSFNNLPDGSYSLTASAAGFAPVTQTETSIGNNDLKVVLPIASPTETVVVQSEVNSYLAESSTTGTKLGIAQRDLPQAISVVPRAVLDDRVVVRLTEAGDNVAGVRSVTG